MNWLNVVILILFVVISVIIAYRLGKAVAVAFILYLLPSDILDSFFNEIKTKMHKKMTPVEKLKWEMILRYCIKEFVL